MIYKSIKWTCLVLLFTINSFGQTNTYNCYLKNINQIDSKTLEFDIWLEWTGSNTQLFGAFQAGIDFNYDGMANGGTITGEYVPGSAGAVGSQQTNPNWNIHQTSKQIRMIAAIASPVILAVVTPTPPGFRLGKFRMTNTVDFTSNSTPNFTWYYLNGANGHTTTKLFFYLASATSYFDVTDQSQHFVENNPIINPTGCTEANAGGPYSSCGDIHLNGIIQNSGTGTWSTSGTGTFDPDNKSLNAIYHPSPTDITSGNITLTLTSDNSPCVSNTTLTFNLSDGDPCTIDYCDQVTGIATHSLTPTVFLGNDTTIQPGQSYTLNAGAGFSSYLWSPNGQITDTINISQGGTYSVVIIDSNGCTASDDISIILLGTKEIKNIEQITVFPNPSNGNFKLFFDDNVTNGQIEIDNLFGEKIYVFNLNNNNIKTHEYPFNLNLSKGTYMIRIIMKNKTIVNKIVIQ